MTETQPPYSTEPPTARRIHIFASDNWTIQYDNTGATVLHRDADGSETVALTGLTWAALTDLAALIIRTAPANKADRGLCWICGGPAHIR